MDGNRRWSASQNVSLPETLRRSSDKLIPELLELCLHRKISHLTLFALSVANRVRPTEEKQAILAVISEFCDTFSSRHANVKLQVIGDAKEKFSVANVTIAEKPSLVLTLAVDYSGRKDILDAVNRLVARNISLIEHSSLVKELSTSKIPNPDILVRYGGKKRLSDFMLYEVAETSLYFLDTLWPDFDRYEFESILDSWVPESRPFGA
jgi:undecaprenyl diphosphate synthase